MSATMTIPRRTISKEPTEGTGDRRRRVEARKDLVEAGLPVAVMIDGKRVEPEEAFTTSGVLLIRFKGAQGNRYASHAEWASWGKASR